jgi:acyl-CoA hydrolase
VESENVRTGEVRHVCTAYLTMVALDPEERPLAVPALQPLASEDERRHREANLRREVRLARPGELRRIEPAESG